MGMKQITGSYADWILNKIEAPWGYYYHEGQITPLSFDQWWAVQMRCRDGATVRGIVAGIDAAHPQLVLV